MKRAFLIVGLLLTVSTFARSAGGQSVDLPQGLYPEYELLAEDTERHLRHLASDELAGRLPGTAGGAAAARYIADRYQEAGLKTLEGAVGYYQPVPLISRPPAEAGYVVVLDDTLAMVSGALYVAGDTGETRATATSVGYGLEADYDSIGGPVDGRIVVARVGAPGGATVSKARQTSETKRKLATKHGAVGIVETFVGSIPWSRLYPYVSPTRHLLDVEAPEAQHVWIRDADGRILEAAASDGLVVTISTVASPAKRFEAPNVVGLIEGTDPELKKEYVVLTAHYDHVGSGSASDFFGRMGSPDDSDDHIYNGARDNGIGVVGLLNAATALSAAPPARSVLFLAVTAEESGLVGSEYFVDHPLVPLDRIAFVLNIDGAGYTDTDIITVIGQGRTTADDHIVGAAKAFELEAIPDPAPEQQLFDRSDHAAFARRGVPAVMYGPGFRVFGPEIMAYYHQVTDEANDDLDYEYIHRFTQSFVRAARLIAEDEQRQAWTPGDKYEAVSTELYGDR